MPSLSESGWIELRRDQMGWFLKKLILLSKTPVTLESYDELICFQVNLMREDANLFPVDKETLSIPEIIDSENSRYYCCPMLEKIKKDIPKLESVGFKFETKDFSWINDEEGYYGYGCACFIDNYVPLFEAYLEYLSGEKNAAGAADDTDGLKPKLLPKQIPKFSLVKGWWRSNNKINAKLFKEGTLRGELLGVLNEGIIRTKESILEILKERTGEEPSGTQMINAMKDINRELTKNKIQRLHFVERDDNLQMRF